MQQIDVTPEFAFKKAIELAIEAFESVKTLEVKVRYRDSKIDLLKTVLKFDEDFGSENRFLIQDMIRDYKKF